MEAVKLAATAEKAAQEARQKGDARGYRDNLDAALKHAANARDAAFRAIDTYAAVAKDRADSGAVATMAEYAYRQLNRKIDDLRKEREKAAAL
jgi:hypothetical protein